MKKKPKIFILYTGGTLGMKMNENGVLDPVKGYLTEQLNLMSEMHSKDIPDFTLKECETLLDSSDMGPDDWTSISEEIERNYDKDYEGFVVIMGTDTMAYAASALSFMLENLGKTVVLTGSIFPLAEVFSDAKRNIIVSMIFATAKYGFNEVCIFFNDKLFRGNRTKKFDSGGIDAFYSPNFPPLADMQAIKEHRPNKNKNLQPFRSGDGIFRVEKRLDNNIIVIRLIPGFNDEALEALFQNSPHLKAVVLELYGTGNAPTRKSSLLGLIGQCIQKGIVFVIASQCPKGSVNPAYALGKKLTDVGAIPARDMTTEAIVTKLSYLLGRGLDSTQVKIAMQRNLRGEISLRSNDEEYGWPIPKL